MPRGMLTLELQITKLGCPESIWVAVRRRNKSHGWRTRCVMALARMLGFREKSKLAAVKKKYEDDGEFRDYVNRYISQFDALLAEAKKRDHDAVLSTTFLSSDMGKVY
ncbi:hypothetical protein LCGC14_1320220, partial [marine sediment metagenome]